jgi:hypothetical protein
VKEGGIGGGRFGLIKLELKVSNVGWLLERIVFLLNDVI